MFTKKSTVRQAHYDVFVEKAENAPEPLTNSLNYGMITPMNF
jgi:hypothetical protein